MGDSQPSRSKSDTDPAQSHVPHILVADDDADARFVLGELLSSAGFQVTSVENGKRALEAARSFEFDLALLDVQMPGISGFAVAEAFKGDDVLRYTPVILITALSEIADVQRGLSAGADDYVVKPFNKDELLARIGAGLRVRRLYEQLRNSRAMTNTLLDRAGFDHELSPGSSTVVPGDSNSGLCSLIGVSEATEGVRALIRRGADSDVPVLITGESGTGKELVAAAFHYDSKRRDRAFVAQNCAALSESLLESELFGHVKGAFTGALRDRAGLFELADGGTLFLDEIGEMKPALQAKLLRVLQDGLVTPVGGSKPRRVNVRIVCATNRDLEREIERGEFRSDLFYRINVLRISLKPLRERREDIGPLSEYFLARISQRTGRMRKRLSQEALSSLASYRWPGNIRELQNELERLVLMSEESEELISADLLDERIVRAAALPSSGTCEAFVYGSGASGGSGHHNSAPAPTTIPAAVAELERGMISAAMHRLRGNKSEAARQLGISRSSLLQKVAQYGIGDV